MRRVECLLKSLKVSCSALVGLNKCDMCVYNENSKLTNSTGQEI